jgi:trk system potassium uptake protein TrkH
MTRVLNLKIISKVISINLFVVGSALAICIGIAHIYSENISPFVLSSTIAISFGFIFLLLSSGLDKNKYLQRKDAYFTVTLSWILLGLVGTLPYILSGTIPSFTNALFESVSGFTTTGASILTDIESLPKSILFWRSLTHWIGGIGIIMVIIIILPSLQIGGYNLFTLESSLQNKLKPKIKDVGKRLLIIYIALTAFETVFLLAGNMNLFDSICHSFGTVATGGFSPNNTSIANYSPYIQYVIMIFMMLAGTNFAIHYYLLKHDFRKIKENEEFRFYLLMIIIIGSIITAALFFKMDKPFEEAFREAFFQVISIITCTGFASSDYLLWPTFAWVLILFAMFLGGSTGSTAGGIKMVRHLILIKNIKNVFRKTLHPNAVIPITLNNSNLPIEINKSTLTFITTYFIVFIIGSLLLIFIGIDGETASSSVATCMAGIGPGIGKVGPANNFAFLPNLAKITLTILMIIGRLEINTVVILFTRNFWKK